MDLSQVERESLYKAAIMFKIERGGRGSDFRAIAENVASVLRTGGYIGSDVESDLLAMADFGREQVPDLAVGTACEDVAKRLESKGVKSSLSV